MVVCMQDRATELISYYIVVMWKIELEKLNRISEDDGCILSDT
jgi:hypothetical protein